MVICIAQARIDSTRLPGKVLSDIGGRPMLAHVLERAKRIAGVDAWILSVPVGQREHFQPLTEALGWYLGEGPHPNVLAAYHQIAEDFRAETIIRVTGDCPFLCPEISSRVLAQFQSTGAAYAANTNPPTSWPEGLDTEVFSREALQIASDTVTGYDEVHHVTLGIRSRQRCAYLPCAEDYRDVKLSVDTQEDLDRARRLYAKVPGPDWTWEDLARVLQGWA